MIHTRFFLARLLAWDACCDRFAILESSSPPRILIVPKGSSSKEQKKMLQLLLFPQLLFNNLGSQTIKPNTELSLAAKEGLGLSIGDDIKLVKEFEPTLKNSIAVSTTLMTVRIAIVNWLIIGFVTEYYTGDAYSPVQDVADSCRTGAATNVIFGLALGCKSVIIPIFCHLQLVFL
ncbi:hypothetical protein KIW84_031927 [Lathyrus oleraceus]|uniref:H(+)-exporting diphosphatase n=1 Tax=Pisum sativum TaxID=3888 RepID=A0A9D4XTM7_PEA|nr:hypothetical protein KIW84_031927 [Pisum sativum]